MAAILAVVLLGILQVCHGRQFFQPTCESFQLENGAVTPPQPHGFLDGETVTVACHAGYELIGNTHFTCYEDRGGWDQNRPQCVRSIVQCEYPDIQNGTITRRASSGDVGETEHLTEGAIIRPNEVIQFQCDESSHMVIGDEPHAVGYKHSVTCLANGVWGGPVPTCKYEQVKCATADFTNGHMYKKSNDGQHAMLTKTSVIPSNTNVYFECVEAHRMRTKGTLQGFNYEHQVLCQLNGEWAGEIPTCESVACDNVAVPNGRVTPAADGGYFNGVMVNVGCDPGYKLLGKAQITCEANGWNHQPGQCIELDVLKCPQPQFDFGHMTRMYQDGENMQTRAVKPNDVIHAGDVIDFRCNYGYKMNGEDDSVPVFQARCQINGKWDRSLPTCQLFECSTPQTTPLLRYTLKSEVDGQKAHYRCLNDNYELLGPTTLTCRIDIEAWFPHRPTCRRKACPTIRWPEDGLLVRHENGTVTAECNDAFTLNGTALRTCLRNGSWSGQPAVCRSANSYCPNPGLPDGGLRSGNEFHFGARVTFSCETNFTLLGEAKQHCLHTGQWSAPAVKCLGPDEYSDPLNAVNRWVDIINNIERDNTERRAEHQVFFLMDSSGSIRNSEVNAQRNFIGNLALKLPNTKMSWVAFNTTAFLLAERQNTSGMEAAMWQLRTSSGGATNVKRAFKEVRDVLKKGNTVNSTKVSIVLLLNDHINEGGSLSNAMRMRWTRVNRPRLYLVTMGGYLNRRDLIGAVSMYEPHSHDNAFFLKHKDDLLDLARGIKTGVNP